ncbi:hypothetical protein Hanom_Chr05g00463511 [Helianthus anomalus]
MLLRTRYTGSFASFNDFAISSRRLIILEKCVATCCLSCLGLMLSQKDCDTETTEVSGTVSSGIMEVSSSSGFFKTSISSGLFDTLISSKLSDAVTISRLCSPLVAIPLGFRPETTPMV